MARLRTQPYCKTCGEPICFLPVRRKDGWFGWAPHNLDDKQPHWRRCKITTDLRKARAAGKHTGEASK